MGVNYNSESSQIRAMLISAGPPFLCAELLRKLYGTLVSWVAVRSAHNKGGGIPNTNIVQILNPNAGLCPFTSIANEKSVRYSVTNSKTYIFYKYSSSKWNKAFFYLLRTVRPLYTRKNAQSVQGWWKQPLCCPHCSMLSTILFSIVTPDCGLIQAQQCWTISRLFLSTLNRLWAFCRV